jgi:hypothetical protein
MKMANYYETCSVYIYNEEKKSEQEPKLHVEGKIHRTADKNLHALSQWKRIRYVTKYE